LNYETNVEVSTMKNI